MITIVDFINILFSFLFYLYNMKYFAIYSYKEKQSWKNTIIKNF